MYTPGFISIKFVDSSFIKPQVDTTYSSKQLGTFKKRLLANEKSAIVLMIYPLVNTLSVEY